MSQKTTIPQIRATDKWFELEELVPKAKVPAYVVINLFIEQGMVKRKDVEKVLQAISELTGHEYTLDNVAIKNRMENW